jgi:hypothetical protein
MREKDREIKKKYIDTKFKNVVIKKVDTYFQKQMTLLMYIDENDQLNFIWHWNSALLIQHIATQSHVKKT